MTTFIFPADVFKPRQVDEEFAEQAEEVRACGGDIILVDHDGIAANIDDRHFTARGIVPNLRVKNAVYRGWMLTLEQYSFLERSLRNKGISLRTEMPQYQAAHHLPGWYDTFSGLTPKTVWGYLNNLSDLTEFINPLEADAFIVKDFVKSRKSDWETACYAPDRSSLPKIAEEFIRLQKEDESLAGGLVVREFESLDKTQGEARIWWVDGMPALITSHPDTPDVMPKIDSLFIDVVQNAVKRLSNTFVTTDIAVRTDGNFRVIEIGDGQVSGLPRGIDTSALWQAL